MATEYRFSPLEHVIYGENALARLPFELDWLGRARAVVITGQSIATQTDYVTRIRTLLGSRFAGVYSGIRQHVPVDAVVGAVATARDAKADVLIALGGGSPIDSTKAVANALAYGWENAEEILAGPKGVPAPGDFPPIVAIPTTLSAAEYSSGVGVTNPATRVKHRLNDVRATPRVVILDPEVTLATPRLLWTSSGIRTLDHAVEAVYAVNHQPVTDALALESIRILFSALPDTVRHPDALAYRTACLTAAWMSYFSPLNVTMSVSHILGQQLGGRFDLMHGLTSCCLLAPTMRFLAATTADRQAQIARAMGVDRPGLSDAEAAAAAADAVVDFVKSLDLPTQLRDLGVPEDQLDEVAESAYQRAKGVSPRPLEGPEDLLEILRAAY